MVIQIVWVVCALVQMWGVDRLHGREIRFSISTEAYFVVLMFVALFSPLLMLLDVVGFFVNIDLHLRLLQLKFQRWVAERHLKNLKSELQRKTGYPFTNRKPRPYILVCDPRSSVHLDRQYMAALGASYAKAQGKAWHLILTRPNPVGEPTNFSTYELVTDEFFGSDESGLFTWLTIETFNP